MEIPVVNVIPARELRLGAFLIDVALAFVVVLPGVALLGFQGMQPLGRLGAAVGYIALTCVQFSWLTKSGQTIGKRAMKLRIVRVEDGALPGFVRVVLLRTLLISLLSLVPLFRLIDILFIFREDQRCLHDLIARTRVVAA